MGRVNALLDECTRPFSGGARLCKTYLGKAADGKEIFLALQAVFSLPELAAGWLDQQEQAPAA